VTRFGLKQRVELLHVLPLTLTLRVSARLHVLTLTLTLRVRARLHVLLRDRLLPVCVY
jgi:hypothetical protein